jgi:hypothetical protein
MNDRYSYSDHRTPIVKLRIDGSLGHPYEICGKCLPSKVDCRYYRHTVRIFWLCDPIFNSSAVPEELAP